MATLLKTYPFNFLGDTDTVWKGYHQTIPAVNISETPEAFVLELAAPGNLKEDFSISVHENTLKISVEKQENQQTYTKREFNFGAFSRTFTLPKTVESDAISAQYINGILSLTIPKKEEAKPKEPKQIEIL